MDYWFVVDIFGVDYWFVVDICGVNYWFVVDICGVVIGSLWIIGSLRTFVG